MRPTTKLKAVNREQHGDDAAPAVALATAPEAGTVSDSPDKQHLPCPFCGNNPGHLLMVKVFCTNEECPIYDLPIDAYKWNTRPGCV